MTVYEPPAPSVLTWVARQIDPVASVVSCERLVGGTTADVDRIVVRRLDGRQRAVVLRRWTTDEAWTDGLVERESAGLQALAGRNTGAPGLVSADPTGDVAGVRCLLMTDVVGSVDLAPADLDSWLTQLADTQARIHDVPPTLTARTEGWFTPDSDVSWLEDPGLRRDAIAAASVIAPDEPDTFVHGDYQHFNVLWLDGHLTGVVDWAMVGSGPRGYDVGHCRLNLAVLLSTAAAEAYLQRYELVSGVPVDPHGDVRGLLGWDPGWSELIPKQVAGRVAVDLSGMAGRVAETIRAALARLG